MQCQPSKEHLEFKEQANTFKLSMTLADNLLTITLLDFTDWAIYSKMFASCSQNNGEKLSLRQFYQAFAMSQVKGLVALRIYQFGSVVRHHEKYSFKIEKEGKLTAYVVKVDPTTKEEQFIESELQLKKDRDMSEVQIQAQKMNINQNLFAEGLLKRVESLEAAVKQEFASTNSKFNKEIAEMREEIQILKDCVNAEEIRKIKEEAIAVKKKVEQEFKEVREEMKSLKRSVVMVSILTVVCFLAHKFIS